MSDTTLDMKRPNLVETRAMTADAVEEAMAAADAAEAAEAPPKPARRLLCLDALRGFDMFWIVGADALPDALRKIGDAAPIRVLATQMEHCQWEGFHFYDLIFPLFVFMAGVSIVFSIGRLVEERGKAAAVRRVVTRGIVLYVLGLLYYGGFAKGLDHVRLLGVLQRIALSSMFAGLLFIALRTRGLVIACAALLLGYWAVMTFVPVPGVGAGNFEEGTNLANYVDQQWLPLRKHDGDHDPEGILSTIPAIGTCLLGVFAGMWLKDAGASERKKVLILAGAGAAMVIAGHAWGLQFPVIKKIWTSSYVLVAGGYSCLMLALFYEVIEIRKLSRWATPFVWIGMNPLSIYLLAQIVDFEELAARFVGGPIQAHAGVYGDLLTLVVGLALIFLVARTMYRNKVFIRL